MPVRTVRIFIPINLIDGHSCYTYTFSDLRITTPRRDEITGRCLSSVHHPVIDQCLPPKMGKAVTKIQQTFDTRKKNLKKKSRLFFLPLTHSFLRRAISSFSKADAKVDTFWASTKCFYYFLNFIFSHLYLYIEHLSINQRRI